MPLNRPTSSTNGMRRNMTGDKKRETVIVNGEHVKCGRKKKLYEAMSREEIAERIRKAREKKKQGGG